MKKIFSLIVIILATMAVAQTPAPDFQPSGEWFNSEPLSVTDLRGKVVLVEMWTFSCYNCYRSKPTLRAFYEEFKEDGFEIVGVHTPEFEHEKVAQNVADALIEHEVSWPVFQDNDFKTWRAYDNRAWPTFYLIDRDGNIRYTHRGELSEKFPRGIAPLREAIAELLDEEG